MEEQFSQMGVQEWYPPTSEEVLQYDQPTETYMCPLAANDLGIEFNFFRVKDYQTQQVLFEVARDPNAAPVNPADIPPELEDQVRCIAYDFGSEFLELPQIATELEFRVGNQPIQEFRMIERHYFRDFLIKSFDFTFGFCIPNSTNSWEAIYDVPVLPPELVEDMIAFPWETQSDSFYFVIDENGMERMVMHNKAKYAYSPPPQ